MTDLATKQQLLDQAGYSYNFIREVYFNRSVRKAFSVDFLEDHTPEVIDKCIRENTPKGEWRFYFNAPPSESVKRELARVLNL